MSHIKLCEDCKTKTCSFCQEELDYGHEQNIKLINNHGFHFTIRRTIAGHCEFRKGPDFWSCTFCTLCLQENHVQLQNIARNQVDSIITKLNFDVDDKKQFLEFQNYVDCFEFLETKREKYSDQPFLFDELISIVRLINV